MTENFENGIEYWGPRKWWYSDMYPDDPILIVKGWRFFVNNHFLAETFNADWKNVDAFIKKDAELYYKKFSGKHYKFWLTWLGKAITFLQRNKFVLEHRFHIWRKDDVN